MVVYYRKTSFSIEGTDLISVGWTAGEKWNTCDCPRFDKNEAIKIMDDFNSHLSEQEPKATYDEEKDTFYFPYEDIHGIELDEYKGTIINTFEGLVKVYAIGTGCWVWIDLSNCNERVVNGVPLKEEN